MRLLLAARLSKLADGQTGLDTQDAEATTWALANHHEIVAVAADRKSGTVQPWDRPHLRPWVTEPERIAQYDGVLAYRLDRLSRGDKASTNAIEQWARQHGKRLLTVDGLTFPSEGVDGIRWDITARIAHDEWLKISERYRRMQGYLQGQGKLTGRPPFGYVVVPAVGGHKTIAPAAVGREYIPQIFQRVIDGDSLATVAGWLNAEGVEAPQHALWSERHPDKRGPEPTREWWPKSIGQLIRIPTYMGHRQDASGRTVLRCEPLVDARMFRRAGEALDTRPKRGPQVTEGRAMLAGALYCPHCADSPMYRIITGRAPHQTAYYRCAGRGAQRHGCGNMVRLETVDAAVDRIAARSFWTPVLMTRTIPGHNYDAELEAVRYEIRQLAHQDLPDAEYDAELARLRAERDRLAALPSVPDMVVEEETGQTYAELWAALGTAERGPWLARQGFRVTADRTRVTLSQPGHPKHAAVSAELAI
jgi:DNA invertase Pin-like site-specific DNA recombinase